MPAQVQVTPAKIQLMVSLPGVTRDGTQLFRDTHIETQWARFYQGRARKILGYREQIRTINGIARQLNMFCNAGFSYIHTGSSATVERYSIDIISGATTGIVDRTPVGYVPNDLNLWQFDAMYDVAGTATKFFAAPTPSLMDITSTDEGQVYWGDILGTSALTPLVDTGTGTIGNIMTSGGIACIAGTFLFVFGADGRVMWSNAGKPSDFSTTGTAGEARPCASKIVRGMNLRGSSTPAIIMWSLDSVIIGQFSPAPINFTFTTVTSTGSLLSANGIIENNGIYYWATTNGFSMFNGVVRDLPNQYNKQYFLDNLNWAQRQKMFATKVPRWSELWFCFPKGSSTECNHAVVYNYADNFWYDTPLPNGGRAAGFYDLIFAYPIMSGVDVNEDTSGTSIWQHEFGLDEISGPIATAKAIKSLFRTSEFSLAEPPQPGALADDRALSFSILEPDFDQKGDLLLRLISRSNARAPEVASDYIVIPGTVTTPDQQTTKFKYTGRLTSFEVTSNEVGGNFTVGSPMIHLQPSDGRRTT